MRSDSLHANRTAFSLVELLVVPVIVIVLSARLLQAIALVRNKAREIMCAINLRQIYIATSGLGRLVAAVHPGAQLPCGSITKVLGHRFDREVATAGFQVHELCADYPQAWAPGVAGWVQWRWLNVAVSGSWDRARRHRLHLHACDPEFRGLTQRVHLYAADAAPEDKLSICVETG